MSLMAVLIEPLLTKKIDTARILKMIIIHDLVEAEATDISALDVLRNPAIRIQKEEREKKGDREHPAGTDSNKWTGDL